MQKNNNKSKISKKNSMGKTINTAIEEENNETNTSQGQLQSAPGKLRNLKNMKITLAKFFIPFIIALIGIFILYFVMIALYDWNTFKFLGAAMILYFIGPAGKESIIPAAVAGPEELNELIRKLPFDIGPINGQPINPFLIAMSIAFIDIVVGLFLVWNFDLAKKIPLLGRFITKFEEKCEKILAKKSWIERLAFTGIVLFVMFPLQGSGGVGASIVGRAIGMNPYRVWYAVIIGALSGCLIIAYSSNTIISILKSVGPFQIIIVILGIIFIISIISMYKKWKTSDNNEKLNF